MELTVITGMSGAGKSQAMGAFEDSGWFVVDNLPPKLLHSLAQLFSEDRDRVERAAVVCDIRGGVFFTDLGSEIDRLEQANGTRPRVLFLEASDQVLLNRYRETRRRHPLAEDAPVIEGIRREREVLKPLRDRADIIIDTSDLNIWDLRRKIIERMIDPEARPGMQVLFVSFGFKHGAPNDADLLFDVRFITNPHYVPEFAPKTGLDPEVAAFVRDAPETAGFIPRLESLLDYLLPKYAEEGKSHLVVGFGCTGGRHRSVYMAERMATRYRGRPEFQVSVTHRDISRATLKAREDADASGRAS
ncbi:MAG: RNase adapter RapZ [Thermoleophilia bacterium]